MKLNNKIFEFKYNFPVYYEDDNCRFKIRIFYYNLEVYFYKTWEHGGYVDFKTKEKGIIETSRGFNIKIKVYSNKEIIINTNKGEKEYEND